MLVFFQGFACRKQLRPLPGVDVHQEDRAHFQVKLNSAFEVCQKRLKSEVRSIISFV
jgi:hypothetical protein